NVEMAARERQYYKALKKYQLAQAEILIKKAAYARAKLHLKYTEIKAPFSGYVQKTNKDVGDLIRQYKYQNSALVKMKKTDPIWVEFSIPEAEIVSLTQKFTGNKEDAGNLSPDTKVKIILSNGTEYKHEGKVVYISVNVNPLTGTNLLRASFPNPNHIVFPGGYVTVKLSSKKKFNEIVIPQKAIQEDQSGNYVLAVDKKNKVHKRHIKLGIPYKNGFVVKTGLKQGEKIITEGLQMVHQGMKVKPVKGKPLSHMIHSKNLGEKSEDSIFDTMYLSSVNKSKKGSEGNAE
ncbi:MAG: efflux RND transporter periplasmic adaptor subunit, partial [Victivallales bacterium]|nr:efflux RND transporter periplasmic adaptor subunit [Victivallales bacterium]